MVSWERAWDAAISWLGWSILWGLTGIIFVVVGAWFAFGNVTITNFTLSSWLINGKIIGGVALITSWNPHNCTISCSFILQG